MSFLGLKHKDMNKGKIILANAFHPLVDICFEKVQRMKLDKFSFLSLFMYYKIKNFRHSLRMVTQPTSCQEIFIPSK